MAHVPAGHVASPDLSATYVDGIVSDGPGVSIDVLRLLDVDMEQVVLVQALGDGNVTYSEHRDLMLDGRTDPLDESPDSPGTPPQMQG